MIGAPTAESQRDPQTNGRAPEELASGGTEAFSAVDGATGDRVLEERTGLGAWITTCARGVCRRVSPLGRSGAILCFGPWLVVHVGPLTVCICASVQ